MFACIHTYMPYHVHAWYSTAYIGIFNREDKVLPILPLVLLSLVKLYHANFLSRANDCTEDVIFIQGILTLCIIISPK